MPGHRDLIVEVTLGIDVVGISGKNVWNRSGTKVPDPHRVAELVERFLTPKDSQGIDLGEGLRLKEGKVHSVTAGFPLIAQIARDEIQAAANPKGPPPTNPRIKPR